MSPPAAALAAPAGPGKVGPNAIIQLAAVLREAHGAAAEAATLRAAGLACYLDRPPSRMTDEREAAALHRTVMDRYAADWEDLSWRAGERTADYLLAHRIPRAVQWLLRRLPAGWAARILVRAIARHAWTFAGSGTFAAAVRRRGITLEIAGNPVAMPGCPWHCGVFTALFRTLVSPRSLVRHEHCGAWGDSTCRFVIAWG
jgi:divinyl protochlorophyllide a 8-vinyl-reductase